MARLLPYLMFVTLGTLVAGCAAEIGDSCSTNLECSPNGDRICDTAQFEGYCTVQGCTYNSCADESLCIAFFPASMLDKLCDPTSEDSVAPGVTPTNACGRNEVCLSSGVCAQATLESRFCMRRCSDDGDCRSGYACRKVGSAGAEQVRSPLADPAAPAGSFCAQR